jgi:hypothetical protein
MFLGLSLGPVAQVRCRLACGVWVQRTTMPQRRPEGLRAHNASISESRTRMTNAEQRVYLASPNHSWVSACLSTI